MVASVEGALAPAIGGSEGDENGVTSRGGQCGALKGEDIVDSKPAAGSVQAAGQAGGRRGGLLCQCGHVDLVEVMGDEGRSVLAGQLVEGLVQGGSLLGANGVVPRICGAAELEKAGKVASVPVELSSLGNSGVAGEDDGVASQGVGGQHASPLEEPGQTGLQEVVYLFVVAEAAPKDMADKWGESNDVVRINEGWLTA